MILRAVKYNDISSLRTNQIVQGVFLEIRVHSKDIVNYLFPNTKSARKTKVRRVQ